MTRADVHLRAMLRHRARRTRDVMTTAGVTVAIRLAWGVDGVVGVSGRCGTSASGTEPDAALAPSQSS